MQQALRAAHWKFLYTDEGEIDLMVMKLSVP
jgi:hypothetical protein